MAVEQLAVADPIAEVIGARDQGLAVHVIIEHVLLELGALRIVERAVRLPLVLRELLLIGLANFVAGDFVRRSPSPHSWARSKSS